MNLTDTLRAKFSLAVVWLATAIIVMLTGRPSASAALSTPITTAPGSLTSPGPVVPDISPLLQWETVSGASGYILYVRDIESDALYTTNVGNITSRRIQGLRQGKSFRWNMEATNGATASAVSTRRYFRLGRPDLEFVGTPDITDEVYAGEDVRIAFTVLNDGDGESKACHTRVQVKFGESGTTLVEDFNSLPILEVGDEDSEVTILTIPESAAPGLYSVHLILDYEDVNEQSDKSDDTLSLYSVFRVLANKPNITPYKPSGWDDKIIVSRSQGTAHDDANLLTTDTIYVDWAIINNGRSATSTRFYTQLYIDGFFYDAWLTDPPMFSNGDYSYVSDINLGQLSAGTHTLRIVTDSADAITESDESDNEYTKIFDVSAPVNPPSPDLVSVTIPSTATVGQAFTVTISAQNSSGLGGADSAITASVLYSDSSHDLSVGNISAGWANALITRSPGETIYNNACVQMTALDHLVEAVDNTWTASEQHSLSFQITPGKEGTIYVRARTTMRNGTTGCDFRNDASLTDGTSGTDQQNWNVRQFAVTVNGSSPAPVASIIGNRTPVTGTTQYRGDSSSGSGLGYSWSTSDGQSSTAVNPQFRFDSPGMRTIWLTVTDSAQRQDSESLSVNVQAANNGTEQGQSLGADPVVLSSGNYISEHVDLKLPGKGFPFEFRRFYNSKFSDQTGAPIGYGWTHSYNERLTTVGTNVLFIRGDGSTWTFFTNTTGGYVAEPGLFWSLVANADGTWSLTDKARTVRTFDSQGRLILIADRNSNALALQYGGSLLASITDTVGRTIQFRTNEQGLLSEIIDPLGRRIRYEYESTNLVRIINAKGYTNRYGYDGAHRMIEAFDAKGTLYLRNDYDLTNGTVFRQHDAFTNWTYFTYDFDERTTWQTNALGKFSAHRFDHRLLITNIVDEAGGETSFEYDANRNRTLVRDKNGNSTRYAYDARGNVTNRLDALGRATSIEYDALDNPVRRVDALTNATTFGYDESGNLTATTNALGHVSSVRYHPGGLPHVLTDARGFSQTNLYDAQGNLTNVLDAIGGSTRFQHDDAGRKVLQIDVLGRINRFCYDESDNLVAAVDALGHTNSIGYDPNGKRVWSRDARGSITSFEYDLKDRLVAVLAPLGRTNGTAYDALDRKVAEYDALGNATRSAFDDVGNLVAVTNALGQAARFTYDKNGNRTSSIRPGGSDYVTNILDELSRVVAEIDPAIGATNLTEFDAAGRVTATTDALGRVTRFRYDAIGRLTNVIDAAGKPALFEHDESGNRVRTVDPNGNAWTNVFDALNRLAEQRNPDGTKVLFARDAVGNITNKVTANGDSIAYRYDARNLLTNVTYPSGPPVSFSYDEAGNRIGMTDVLGATAWRYDALSRLTSVTDPFGQTVSNAFDAQGNRVSLHYPGSKEVRYSFDALNRMIGFTNWLGGVVAYTYDQRGNLERAANADGTSAAYGYDASGRLTALTNSMPGGAVIASYARTIDAAGNPTELAHEQPLFPILASQTNRYTYDADNRLASVDGEPVTHTGSGALTSIGVGKRYAYDFEDRLTAFTNGTIAGTCSYDGVGNRLERTVSGVVRRFALDRLGALTQVLVEADNAGAPAAYNVYGLGLAQRITPAGEASTYHFDPQGSAVALTDSAGAVTDSYAYDSFGVLANSEGSSPQPFRYLARYGIIDDGTGLSYARARFFSAELGRFLTKDPIDGRDGNSQSLNRYVYAFNNPRRFFDPTGLVAQDQAQASQYVTFGSFLIEGTFAGAEKLGEYLMYLKSTDKAYLFFEQMARRGHSIHFRGLGFTLSAAGKIVTVYSTATGFADELKSRGISFDAFLDSYANIGANVAFGLRNGDELLNAVTQGVTSATAFTIKTASFGLFDIHGQDLERWFEPKFAY